jgi:hypothetical protein
MHSFVDRNIQRLYTAAIDGGPVNRTHSQVVIIVAGVTALACAALYRSSLPVSAEGDAQAQKLKLPGPDAQNLMLGSWSIRVEYAPGPKEPKGHITQGTEVWRAGPGNFSVIEEYREKSSEGEMQGLGTAWWDEQAHGQRFVWCDNWEVHGCYLSKNVAKWEGSRLVYSEDTEDNGIKTTHQEIFSDITPSSFLQTLLVGPVGGPMKTVITIHATRIHGSPKAQ